MAWTDVEMTEFMRRVRVANTGFRESASSLRQLLPELRKTPRPAAGVIQTKITAMPVGKRTQYDSALKYLYRHYPNLDQRTIGGYTLIGFESIPRSEVRAQRAIDSIQMTYRLSKTCEAVLNSVKVDTALTSAPSTWTREQTRATESFQRWFDASRRPSSRDTVRRIFTTMKSALEGENFEIVVYGVPEDKDIGARGWHLDISGASNGLEDAFAFVIKGENAYRIYMASAFFAESDTSVGRARPVKAQVAQDAEQWQAEKRAKVALDAAVITTLHELTHIRAIGDTDDVPPGPYDIAVCKRNARTTPRLAITNAENYALFAKEILLNELFRIA